MKKFYYLSVLTCLICIPVLGQEHIEDISFSSDNIIKKNFGLPVVRKVYGGTKIIPEFEGNWTNEMKGAFEYACKIWEEAMPTTFPIRIKAILDETSSIYQNKPVFSKITTMAHSHTSESFSYFPYSNMSTLMQIKGTKFNEFSGQSDTRIYDGILTQNMFIEPDAIIRYYNYNNKLVDNCSFSLEGLSNDNYYDFVTLALRDIAKSFGLVWTNKIIRTPETLKIDTLKLTPFEKHIIEALNADNDFHQAYLNATKGKIYIGENGEWTLYAPTVWDTERSLNYFIPDTTKKITELLSYEFGRGSVIRDVSCYNTYYLFKDLLQWKGDIAIGLGEINTFSDVSSSTKDVVPFKGQISILNNNSLMSNYYDKTTIKNTNIQIFETTQIDPVDNLQAYINQFHPNYNSDGSIDKPSWTISLLKKDGTWDIVYIQSYLLRDLNVKTSDFKMHDDIENYARSCDGYLRCRITKSYYALHKIVGDSYYYILDYLPQKVKMMKSRVMDSDNEEDYYRDVIIGLKDIEGITRVVVSQLDEGNELPYQYEVPDFKKGYFIATVDKEFSSTFTITAYNKNGSTVSYPYVLGPLSPTSNIQVSFILNKDNIQIEPVSRKMDGKTLVTSYEIHPLVSNNNDIKNSYKRYFTDDNSINISSLTKGYYTLTVYDIRGEKHSFKFMK